MKCPLFIAGEVTTGVSFQGEQTNCLGEECAWWSKNHELCDINSIAKSLWWLKEELFEIAEKMPHELQFRK